MTGFERRLVLANLGAFTAFMPLLVLLLPRRIEAVAPTGALAQLSLLLLVGGLVASGAHVLGGWWSDRWMARTGSRRTQIAIGLVAVLASLVAFGSAMTLTGLMAAMIGFQFSFNILFAPLNALLADYVPDPRKGLVAGAAGGMLPLAGFTVSIVGWVSASDAAWPFAMVAAAVGLGIAPLLLGWTRDPVIATAPLGEAPGSAAWKLLKGDFAYAWIARLLVQLGAVVVISYLFLYVDTVARGAPGFGERNASSAVALLALVSNLFAIAAGLLAGRWSDRLGARRPVLVATALLMAAMLALLALAPHWGVVIAAHALFTAALTAFLAVDSAMVASLVAGRRRRGALLGMMNLTNTLPSVLAPAIALTLAQAALGGAALVTLLWLAAGATVVAALAVLRIRTIR
ncbi:MFS transporter [Sphingomicrobium aestuariivivum]|uniref:MFS transporter n=1 Tax=Sphingomicrobium aestuariivivum TaxID=1582356 RepID=UPI001FD6B659|nr:MFS transporter [Sphingomicrobium aestuariivivum]MCJ8190898.1 MFS transporter [Sphingomicrobium aestuariivivum]